MHGDMTGYYEIRLTGPSREQFRLFCLLENGSDDEPTTSFSSADWSSRLSR